MFQWQLVTNVWQLNYKTDVWTVRTFKIIKAWTKRNLLVTVCSMNVPQERGVLVMLPLLHVDWSPNKAVGQRQEAAEPGLPAKNVTGQKKIYGTKTIMHVNNCYPDLKQWFVFQLWQLVILEARNIKVPALAQHMNICERGRTTIYSRIFLMNPAVISPLNGWFRLEETFRVVPFAVLNTLWCRIDVVSGSVVPPVIKYTLKSSMIKVPSLPCLFPAPLKPTPL